MVKLNFDYIILNMFASVILCFVMYLTTAVVIVVVDGLNINEMPIGILALILYFLIPFITIQILDFKGEEDVS